MLDFKEYCITFEYYREGEDFKKIEEFTIMAKNFQDAVEIFNEYIIKKSDFLIDIISTVDCG